MTLTIRENLEKREYEYLSEFATKSAETKGRNVPEDKSDLRTDFQRDRDRILHSKAFRRLKHKTQVFLSPFDDHFRTRLTHTLEVSQIGRTIARALNLNEDLVEAISLGHDLGHTPFGHCGEGVLNELVDGGFHHNIQSVRVVEVLEHLNLCRETVDAIKGRIMTLTIRENLEKREYEYLSEFATKSAETKGRNVPEDKSDLRTDFQRDRDRILHSKAFRRLKHKTQVFLSPFDDHFRTRLTHTLEVSQIGRTIARALNLNEDLVEAISLGHDLGHTPFGHCGEGVLNELVDGGFHHNIQSVRVVEVLEHLNLCRETVDGILTHTWGFNPITPEGKVVQLADKIAYINHDIEDSIMGV